MVLLEGGAGLDNRPALPQNTPMSKPTSRRGIFLAVLLIGAGARALDLNRPADGRKRAAPEGPMNLDKQRAEAKAALVAKHGEAHRARIERGVDQVASLWRESDGDFAAFVPGSSTADAERHPEASVR